ncbi:AAA ATPase [Aspergillus campestris IBT 28561]|uniref:Midasin n=1 Tax=Aspergillus campestris (strain IBT 28561) TaxID=1392248 RepID=A0A2I1CUU3_ASPC2|nr:AAA ATPase [Aspergillus campestris IBT 28561]PKY01381.1 AAA ATPase [Aspergillus campestris IBT 28561]
MNAGPAYTRTLNESQILEQLPNEIAELIRTASGTQYLNALAVGALRSTCIERFFCIYEPIFVDLAARWLDSDLHADQVEVISAFGRILPFAPYLRSFASQYAVSRAGPLSALATSDAPAPSQLEDSTLRTLLLAIFRLMSFDLELFSKAVSPSRLQSLFRHRDRSVRYLAVRCFALYMRAADAATERIVWTNIPEDTVEGEWEGIVIDYRCLGLWEEQRWNTLEKQIQLARSTRSIPESLSQVEQLRDYLTPRTAEVCGVLIPRLTETPSSPSSIVKTPTAIGNLRKIATALTESKPMLLIGLPNSGKTTLSESMVTLHLNEQTDAKSLLGMYSTSPATGSFAWQPGVLTKAAREGRWILIEDLNRAPSEVIGLILPIIEKGELTIASRKERIKCAEGFKIIATMKSSYNIAGEEVAPSTNILGSRLWERVQVDSFSIEEVQKVITEKFPLLESRVPTIMNVYQKLCSSFHGSLAIKSSQGRTPGLRDLIKLCSRMHRRLKNLGAKTGYEATPEGAEDEMFLDIVDIFLTYIPEKSLADSLALVVAEALQISPQRARFCLHERTPPYSDQGNSIILGRETCQKIKVPSGSISKTSSSRFASTRSALKLMEQVAAAVQMAEPTLLVGETGIGKTTVIQRLATLMRQKLTVVNLSQQSESTDLLGGFKPVNIRTMAVPMLDEFNALFELTFSAKKNQKFLSSVAKSVAAGNWTRLLTLWHEAVRLAEGVFKSGAQEKAGEDGQPSKKRKLDSPKYQYLRQRWDRFSAQLEDFEMQVSQGDAKFAFAFVQGKIVRALRNGEWVLLDEINLASPDTLENIASLLHHGTEGSPSVLLSEAGDVERVFGHPDFRIFGAMNPATDAGKKDLPPGLRSRFTECYVQPPDSDLDDLLSLIQKYLGDLSLGDSRIVSDLAQLYMETKALSNHNKLTDGAGQRPHFSIRTLVRALVYHIFNNSKNARAILGQTPRPPDDGHEYVQFKHYWMRQGPFPPKEEPHYIITPFIEKNLKNLVRASSTRRFPVLLQGPTSAGKTSMIEYLAKVSGNKFVRINNHEHTDLQEYLGSYVSGDDGTLRYQEGILVEALRNGYWIVLDELNLAPSDVLEALNRLLDDNRELFIPETQEVVHPHSNFMLFATQNPAGLYGGRKVLSRAFRNRFLELHFDDIPESELEFILKERSQIAPSFCARIVSVYRKLSLLRQANRLFEQKNSFATLRDLFRWALREADDREQLAVNGFMLLAERVRNPQERAAVKGVIEEVMRVRIDEDVIYSTSELEKRAPLLTSLAPGVVWTKAMRRLFILVSAAIENNEPVLLVGETGCGKTQLCQAVAEAYKKHLLIVNAHVNLETGDLIGAQRPIRNRAAIESQLLTDVQAVLEEDVASKSPEELKQALAAIGAEKLQGIEPGLIQRIEANFARLNALFEWSDGSLITAMKTGQFFLLDEISLADDSVLERLNSVLEPHRSILLAEKGPIDSMVVADRGFQFLSTMNPGGDYGKRELSAALRNRMTEIWAPQLSEDDDILPILQIKIQLSSEQIPKSMLQFAKWFKWTFQNSTTTSLSIRDLLAWVDFVNKCQSADPLFSVVQGAAMVFIDTLGANPAAMLATALDNLEGNRRRCLDKLRELFDVDAASIYLQKTNIDTQDGSLRVGPFSLAINGGAKPDPEFIMDAPTTLPKPILMEGSPGVGKTTLPLTRINLSEQTDLTDLFGSDVPVEGGDVGQFTWRDAPFLQAMQRGDWSVLEGLNACLDHRQTVYVAELDQTFHRHPNFVLFAAQNPHHQGGGRKGLPASFVNRFTVVYADAFTDTDLKRICAKLFPGSPTLQTDRLVKFVSLLNTAITKERRLGVVGGPWEVNLRDIQRWLQLADRGDLQISTNNFLDVIISQRFRTAEDRELVSQLYNQIFNDTPNLAKSYYHNLTPEYMQVGLGVMQRDTLIQQIPEPQMRILPADLPTLESLMLCIEQAWPSILVGPSGCGKTTLIRKLAAVNGAHLVELALSADTDTMDLIGGFEQIDYRREVSSLVREISLFLSRYILSFYSPDKPLDEITGFLELHEGLQDPDVSLDTVCSMLTSLCQSFAGKELEDLLRRAQALSEVSKQSHAMRVGFEWTEGVLTQAVQHGHWVVLDNANLCNPSVLDRLNSLAEPNGDLILNEQRTEDGSARIITPHPNFRLFLTVDPRHGELSRAMRNRCVEICFLPQENDPATSAVMPSYTCQSFLYRLRTVWSLNSSMAAEDRSRLLHEVCFDHLSVTDLAYLQRSTQFFVQYFPEMTEESLLSLLHRFISVVQDNTSWKPLESTKAEIQLSGASFALQGPSQPIHPLVNEPLVAVMCNHVPVTSIISLAQLQEVKLDLHRLRQGLLQADESGKLLKPSQMSRLERSLASGRIPSLMKDPTQPVGFFLSDCGQALYDFVQGLGYEDLQAPHIVHALRAVVNYCADVFRVSTSHAVDEGEFQIYLQTGRELCTSFDSWDSLKPLALSLSQGLSRFQENWALKTGLSMQRLWETWRPATPATHDQLASVLDLEKVASEFTGVATKTHLDLSQLSKVRNSLIEAQRSILMDGADEGQLVQALSQTVSELKSVVQRSVSAEDPYFTTDFEALCQYHDISSLVEAQNGDETIRSILPLLAMRPARPLDLSKLKSQVPGMLHRLALFAGSANSSMIGAAVTGTMSLSLLGKLKLVDNTSLGQMASLEIEKRVLSKAVALTSREISMNQMNVLRQVLTRLAKGLLSAHGEFLEPQSLVQISNVFQAVEENGSYNGPSFEICLEKSLPADHYFKDYAQRALPNLIHSLTTDSQEDGVDGNIGAAVVQLAVILLRLFVPDKPFDPSLSLVVQRQRHSQRTVELTEKADAISSFEVGFSGQSSNARHRIVQEELRDLGAAPPPSSITRPQASEINLLQGEFSNLLKSVLDRCSDSLISPADGDLSEAYRMINLIRDNVRQLTQRLTTHYRSYDDITVPVVRFLQLLDLGLSLHLVQAISRSTPFLAETSPKWATTLWFHELSSLHVAQNADPGILHTAAGREALRRLFGQFHVLWKAKLREDQETEEQKSNLYHYKGSWEDNEEVDENELKELFPTYDENTADEEEKPSHINTRDITVRIASLHAKLFQSQDQEAVLSAYVKHSLTSRVHPKEHVPGILLLLEGALDRGSEKKANYNFYTDANLVEAKRLIQQTWPEHAEILQFKHAEPIAKFLTKLVASRDWRRVELSTWARLLDLEKEKCDQDLAESGEELGDHIREVVSTLEQFFKSTSLGQYSSHFPSLGQVCSALDNFVEHYRQFEPPIHKILNERRTALEKDIKEQIQLASWKDTNIVILRESAQILAQPAQQTLEQDMPEGSEEPTLAPSVLALPSTSFPEALAMCQRQDGIWANRAPRFRDPDGTASNMKQMYVSIPTEFDMSEDMDGFAKYFIESIQEFKTQTPKTLTEDNKDDVQHMKVQKRRFYGDILRHTSLMETQATVAQNSDLYFHRILDILPRVRQAAHDYCEELSNVEISRSAGKQRATISPAFANLGSLRALLSKITNLWSAGPASVSRTSEGFSENTEDVRAAVLWLTPILGLAATTVKLHSNFSGIDASEVSRGLQEWKSKFSGLRSSLDGLPELPHGIAPRLHKEVLETSLSSFTELKAYVTQTAESRPDLSFVLDQIVPWTNVQVAAAEGAKDHSPLAIEEFESTLLTTVDKILISLQKLKEVPNSLAPTGSLARSDEFFTRAIKAAHLSEIIASLEAVLDKLQLTSNSEAGIPLAITLVASLLPIMSKYHSICKDIVDRFVTVHRETCKMSYILSKSFIQVASEGFCTPQEESTEEGNAGKLEGGTGLGAGEGAEDISKDVGDDEDLTELAQEENTEQDGEMDDSKDAVNMDQEDLRGEDGERKEEEEGDDKDEDGEEEDNDIDEETGSMWDGGKGASETDEQTAAQNEKEAKKDENGEEDENEEQESEVEEDEEAPEEEGEAEEEALDLPEEMQLDGDEKGDDGAGDSDDDFDDGLDDDLPDTGAPENEQEVDNLEDPEGEVAEAPGEDEEMGENENEEDFPDEGEAEGGEEDTKEPGEEEPEEAQQDDFLTQQEDNEMAGEEVAPSEANQEKGSSGNAQQEQGSTDQTAEKEEQTGASKDGEENERHRDAGGGEDSKPEDPQLQAFKKLGDVLEEWHRRQKEIKEASQQEDGETEQPLGEDADMADADFEHLADQDDAQALDQNKGVESDIKPGDNEPMPDVTEEGQDLPANMLEDDDMQLGQDGPPTEGQGAFIPGNIDTQERTTEGPNQTDANDEIDAVDAHLAAIHLSSTLPPLTPRDEAQRLWSHYESATNALSLSLTEQLRLILAPTMATKLRGDFRTGKRLNIKRIIPYIASQYKRDKIWMRRSIPSKRNYQIMLAVDDSKSMLESGSGQLAFETLALVAKSLSMLEAGDLCVLGFGSEDHVRVAHEFGQPFSADAGSQVFQHFSYQQTGTNVRKLIADSIALFREARWKQSPGAGNADLWQLELVISDGICEDHDTIRRLVRQAQEERIMIVFIIVDAVKGSSILDLSQASFEPDEESGTGEMKLKMKRYLEGFPFPYYLVVRDVRELPAVLATALKQWFAEVVDVSS